MFSCDDMSNYRYLKPTKTYSLTKITTTTTKYIKKLKTVKNYELSLIEFLFKLTVFCVYDVYQLLITQS